jgi:AhpD family alkylhydroperoxidase
MPNLAENLVETSQMYPDRAAVRLNDLVLPHAKDGAIAIGHSALAGTHHRPPRRARRAQCRPHERIEGTMTEISRVNIGKQHPAAYKAIIVLSAEVEEAAAAAGLDPLLVELLKISTSQINGCSFCLRMHTRDALKKGEKPRPDRRAARMGRPATSPRPTEPPSA